MSYNWEYRSLKPSIRNPVLERDGNTCQKCFDKTLPVQVHHINGNRKDNSLSNLVCLCRHCHTLVERELRGNKKRTRITKKYRVSCGECGLDFLFNHLRNKKFCSKSCLRQFMGKQKKINLPKRYKRIYERLKIRYKTDTDFRERRLKYNRQYRKNIILVRCASDPNFKEKMRLQNLKNVQAFRLRKKLSTPKD